MTLIPVRAKVEFSDVTDTDTLRIQIRQNGFSGTAFDIRIGGQADPRIDYMGGEDIWSNRIIGSRFSFSIVARTANELALIDDMINAEFGEFAITYVKNSVVQWRGFVYPEMISKGVRYNGLYTIVAGDCLALMQNNTAEVNELSIFGIFRKLLDDGNSSREGMFMSRLYNDNDVMIRSNVNYLNIHSSTWFKSYLQEYSHRRSLANLFEGMDFYLQKLACRCYQGEGGVFYIQSIPRAQYEEFQEQRYEYDSALPDGISPINELGVEDVSPIDDLTYVYTGDAVWRQQPAYQKVIFFLLSKAPFDTWYFYPRSSVFDSSDTIVSEGATYTHNSSTYEVILVTGNLSNYTRSKADKWENRIRPQSTNPNAGNFPAGINGSLWLRRTSGSAGPQEDGTLTKASGVGPATIEFTRVERATETVTDDLSQSVSIDSNYEFVLPFQDILTYTPPTSIARSNDFTYFRFGGHLAVTNYLVTDPQDFGIGLLESEALYRNLITGGEFRNGDESNWTANGYTPTTPSSPHDGTMRLTVTSTTSSDITAYQEITTENGEDYVCVIETTSLTPNGTNGPLPAYKRVIQYDTTTSPTLFTGSYAETDWNDQGYMIFEFTAVGTTGYIHIGSLGGTAGDRIEVANCKVIKKSVLQKHEQLLVDEIVNHYRLTRKVWNLTVRGTHYFNNLFKFGDSLILPTGMTILPGLQEVRIKGVDIANDDFIYWDGVSFSTLLRNGQATNQVSRNTSNQRIDSQQICVGGYTELEFYPTPAQLSGSGNTQIQIGFIDEGAAAGTILNDIDHSFYLLNDTVLGKSYQVYEGSSSRYTGGTWSDTDKFTIRCDGRLVQYLVNDTVVYTSADSALNFPVMVRCYLNTNGEYGIQKIRLRAQCMKYPYKE